MAKIRVYYGQLGKYVIPYLRKRFIEGFDINGDVYVCESFLSFLFFKCGNPRNISKADFLNWITTDKQSSASTFNNHISIAIRFLKFLNSEGVSAWYPTSLKILYKRRNVYVPHIFSSSELQKIIKAADSVPFIPSEPLRHLSIPIMFRFLINFGLRASEVCNIHRFDVFSKKIIIKDAKKSSFRLIPLSMNMEKILEEYIRYAHGDSKDNKFLFLSSPDRRITTLSLYTYFRKILQISGISHKGRGFGPRLIDFRHTFCVLRIRNWLKEGRDMMEIMPYLSRFLGHSSISQTAYYFSLVPDLFEDIRTLESKFYQNLLPDLDWEFDYEKQEF